MLKKFIQMESSASVVLAISTLLALLVANSAWSTSYFDILETHVLSLSLLHWINDALMVIFFFVVALEIKRELVSGELSSFKQASLPVAAAVGGMVVPALIYFFFNGEVPVRHGWGIPMATDIAFAVGVLTLFGKRVPLSLKIFLLAIAIVDDLGAILVIALFYAGQLHWLGLGIALLMIALVIAMSRFGVLRYRYYIPLGIGLWFGIMSSGVHATIAGVILGLLTPVSSVKDLVDRLHPWVSFLIMPLFAFANAGIDFSGANLPEILNSSVSRGIFFGLLVGKPVGIFLASYLCVRLGLSRLPKGFRWSQVFAVGCLAGIGFTMSLFISGLALPHDLQFYSKVAIFAASLSAAVLGGFVVSRNLS